MKYESKTRVLKRLRLRFVDVAGHLGAFTTMVGEHGGMFGEIATVGRGRNHKIRDMDILVADDKTLDTICDNTRKMEGVDLLGVTDVVQETHLGGKIEVSPRVSVRSVDDLRIVYTPGVADMCRKIARRPSLAYRYTSIQNNVAIVTNGTAILGLGDIGPVAGMPVIEGKALLFKLLAGINGYPVLIDSKDAEVIIRTVKAISPSFGAIKLEDIRAPECFEIEDRLDAELDIPVVHDDQHGTAVVVLAALLNIAKYTYINLRRSSVGIIGLGAAGSGIFKLLKPFGMEEIYGTDIAEDAVRRFEVAGGIPAGLEGVMKKSKIVIATTAVPGLIEPAMVQPKQVILALSNPDPEISPDEALASGAAFAADGKAVNNALAFPGLFRGALDARAKHITDTMKIAAAKVIAEHAPEGELVPDILDREIHVSVAKAVEEAALKTGVVKYVDDLEL